MTMTPQLPDEFFVSVTRVYTTKEYLEDCKESGIEPTKEGFVDFIADELREDFGNTGDCLTAGDFHHDLSLMGFQ